MSNIKSGPHFEPFIRIKNESGTEDIHYHALYEGLPEEFKRYAREVLNETEEGKEKGLRELKDYIQEENLASVDDDSLLAVLRACKYDMKDSRSKLRRFSMRRQRIQDKLIQIDPETMNAVLDDLISCILPYRDKDGRIIFYACPNFRFDLYSMQDVLVCNAALFLMFIRIPMTSVAGVAYIGELRFPVLQYYEILKASKDCITFLLDVPLRLGRADVNAHFLTRLLFAAARPFLPEKLTGRIYLHEGGFDEVKELYHPSLLPDVLEGTAGPLSDNFYRQKLMVFIEELKAERYRNVLQSLLCDQSSEMDPGKLPKIEENHSEE